MEKRSRVFAMSFGSVYPLYVQKAARKGRTKKEVDAIITWLTGYESADIERVVRENVDIESFFEKARMNPNAKLITGVVCGVRVEEIDDPMMQKVRYLDKLIDELAKGKQMTSILRETSDTHATKATQATKATKATKATTRTKRAARSTPSTTSRRKAAKSR